jgi:transposase-like protein
MEPEAPYEPTSLRDAIVYFSKPENGLKYMVAKRWPNGVVTCPTCGSIHVSFLVNQQRWQCSSRHPRRQFSIKTGTIFEDSPLGLDKWLPCVWLVTNCKNGVSSWEIHRALEVTQKTAWFMLHRIRLAMQDDETGGKLDGQIEVDETFIGGKSRNMYKHVRARKITGTGGKDKTAVMGILQRGGKVRTKVVANRKKTLLQAIVKAHVEPRAVVYTDTLKSYECLDAEHLHQFVDHAVAYVNGQVHTNGMENFWSLLKRSLSGTYVSVEPFHLFRYVDEQAFRCNNRQPMNGSNRFSFVVRKIVRKRLTCKALTGKQEGMDRSDMNVPF